MSPITGSFDRIDDVLIGTMDFYQEGGVNVFMTSPDEVDKDIYESFKMTTSFIFHALTRSDWMTEFFIKHYQEDTDDSASPTQKRGPKLTLLKGGKED